VTVLPFSYEVVYFKNVSELSVHHCTIELHVTDTVKSSLRTLLDYFLKAIGVLKLYCSYKSLARKL